MSMPQPRVSALNDVENRLRGNWRAFTDVWQQTAEGWKDKRRVEFEKQYLSELPIVLSRARGQLTQFRDAVHQAMRALADDEAQR